MVPCSTKDNFDCAYLFEGVHPAFTIAQAIFTILIMIVTLPINAFLISAIIKFHEDLEGSFALCASVFISNMILTFSFGIGVVISSIARDWPLGSVGCQIFGTLVFIGLATRWMNIGVLCIDKFCRIVFPFCYSRHSSLVVKVLVSIPWAVTLIRIIPFQFGIGGRFQFIVQFPTCSIQQKCSGLLCYSLVSFWFVVSMVMGCALPIVLQTLMYLKSKKFTRETNVPQGTFGGVQAPRLLPSQIEKRANTTFCIMMAIFIIPTAIFLFLLVLNAFEQYNETPYLPVFFVITDLFQLYVLLDLFLLWKNQQGKCLLAKIRRKARAFWLQTWYTYFG